jgi:hypothetical protein
LILKQFLPLKIQINWKEKSVEDVVILGPTAHVTLVDLMPQHMLEVGTF